MPQNIKDSLTLALTALTDITPEGSSILHAIYKRYSGFEKTSDNDFVHVRAMMSRLGILEKQ